MHVPLRAIEQAAADLEERVRREGLAKTVLAALDAPIDTREEADGLRCSVGSGRGPVIAWILRDGVPDPEAGLTIVIDTSATSGDFDLVDYRYGLDGGFRRRSFQDYTAVFRS